MRKTFLGRVPPWMSRSGVFLEILGSSGFTEIGW